MRRFRLLPRLQKNPKSSSLQFHRTSCVHYLCVSISWYQPLIPASVKITFSRTVNMRAPSDNRLFSMFSKSDFFSSTIFKAKGYPPTAKQMLIVSLMQIHLQSKEDFSLQRILHLHKNPIFSSPTLFSVSKRVLIWVRKRLHFDVPQRSIR